MLASFLPNSSLCTSTAYHDGIIINPLINLVDKYYEQIFMDRSVRIDRTSYFEKRRRGQTWRCSTLDQSADALVTG